MSGQRGAGRAFVGRLAVALVVTASLMVGAVVAVNYVIDVKLGSVSRVGLHTGRSRGGTPAPSSTSARISPTPVNVRTP